MKPTTRDDLIYLAVGLSIAGLVAFDFFYADSHGREMWWPSNFWSHLVLYLLLLEYFVVRETRKAGATFNQVLIFLFAGLAMHTGLAFALRGLYNGPLTFALFSLTLLEFFVFVQLAAWSVRRWRRTARPKFWLIR